MVGYPLKPTRTAVLTGRSRSSPGELSDSTQLLLTFASFALTLGVLFAVEYFQLPYRQMFRYLGILPVVIVGFFYGFVPALVAAGAVSARFLLDLVAGIWRSGFTLEAAQTLVFLAFLHLLAYVFADLSASIRAQFRLRATLQGQEALLARASSQQEVIDFLLNEGKRLATAEQASFLVLDPLNAQWEIIKQGERAPLLSPGSVEDQPLAEWLLYQKRPVLLNQLDRPGSWICQPVTGPDRLRSLLACPLRRPDGSPFAWLVLFNKEGGRFLPRDLDRLAELLKAGGNALEQAEIFARTDRALSVRVAQLAAIQRTARELNQTLDYGRILEQTVACALEIAGGQAGFAGLFAGDFPLLYRSKGERSDPAKLAEVLRINSQRAQARERPTEAALPYLLPNARARLLAPIRRRQTTIGMIVVEQALTQASGANARNVLSILSDHAAIALENARLFLEVQREEKRTSLIIHSIADGLITTDTQGRILILNPAAEAMTGWRREEACGLSLGEVLHLVDRPDRAVGNPLSSVLHEHTHLLEFRQAMHTRLGARRVISLSMAPLLNGTGEVDGAAILFRDVTHRDEQDRLQREMIASLSHELRAPLANIRVIAEMLLEEGKEALKERQRRDLDVLLGQSQQLADFLDRLLDVHRIETGKFCLQRRPLPAALLIEEAASSWRSKPAGYAIHTRLPKRSPWVWGDEVAIQSVLNNLLENAFKYSSPGVEVTLSVCEGPDGKAHISVHDRGPGIAPEHQEKIFNRFYRVDGGDAQAVYGHGLGLYICRSLVRAMGGEIWVESQNGRGCKFTFTLPIKEANNDEGEGAGH